MTAQAIATHRNMERAILLLIAFGAMIMIAFLDEGRNSFSWMTDRENWITLGLFTLLIFIGQLLSLRYLVKRAEGIGRILFAALGGFVFFGVVMMVYGMLIMAVR